jgi:hypothetical protein
VVNDGSTGSYAKGTGTVINIVGTGGFEMTQYGNIYTWDGDNKYFATYMGGNLTPRFGWVKVTVSASQLRAQFMDATNTSNYTDQYTITPPVTPTATSTPPAGATASNTPVPGGTPVALATVSGNSLSTPKGIAQVGTQVWVANNATSTISRFNQDSTPAGSPLSGNGLSGPRAGVAVNSQVRIPNYNNGTLSLFWISEPARAERRRSARERGRGVLAPLSRKEPRRAAVRRLDT